MHADARDGQGRHLSDLARLYFYMRTKPAGDAKKFIDWVLSPEGQGIVTSRLLPGPNDAIAHELDAHDRGRPQRGAAAPRCAGA